MTATSETTITAPTRLLETANERCNSYSLVEHLPNAVLLVYPDAGHGSLFQWHDSFVNLASQFLASDSQLAPY